MVERDTIIVDGKKHEVNMIRKDGVTYTKTRDIAELVGYQVGSHGKVPVLTKELKIAPRKRGCFLYNRKKLYQCLRISQKG